MTKMTETTKTTKLITLSDYMADSSKLHHDYNAQFITPATVDFVNSRIGIDKLLTSKDKYLNDLYSHSQGGAGSWVWDFAPVNIDLIGECGDTVSPSRITSISKTCAHILIEEHKASQDAPTTQTL